MQGATAHATSHGGSGGGGYYGGGRGGDSSGSGEQGTGGGGSGYVGHANLSSTTNTDGLVDGITANISDEHYQSGTGNGGVAGGNDGENGAVVIIWTTIPDYSGDNNHGTITAIGNELLNDDFTYADQAAADLVWTEYAAFFTHVDLVEDNILFHFLSGSDIDADPVGANLPDDWEFEVKIKYLGGTWNGATTEIPFGLRENSPPSGDLVGLRFGNTFHSSPPNPNELDMLLQTTGNPNIAFEPRNFGYTQSPILPDEELWIKITKRGTLVIARVYDDFIGGNEISSARATVGSLDLRYIGLDGGTNGQAKTSQMTYDDVVLKTNGKVILKSSSIDTNYSNELQFTNAGLNITSSSYPELQQAWTIQGLITLNQTTSFPLMSWDSGSEILLNIDDSFIALSKGGIDIFNHTLTTSLGDGSANAITIKRSTDGIYETFVNGTRSPDSSTTDTITLGTVTNDLYHIGFDTGLDDSGTFRLEEFSVKSTEQSDQDDIDFGLRIVPPS